MTKRPKRDLGGEILIDGLTFGWSVHREPQWCTADGWKGLSICVQLANGKGRQLLLEYPIKMSPNGMAKLPQRPKVSTKSLETDIRRALGHGWQPLSRGKAFAIQISN
jgi:hypothetical protein